jgi:hypothetical protein
MLPRADRADVLAEARADQTLAASEEADNVSAFALLAIEDAFIHEFIHGAADGHAACAAGARQDHFRGDAVARLELAFGNPLTDTILQLLKQRLRR